MPQLDSLRALAFLGVAASHWIPGDLWVTRLGGTGVQLFFVLSGFLITGILLDYRGAHERDASISLGKLLRIFYARRALRIFPLFYGVLGVTAILDVGPSANSGHGMFFTRRIFFMVFMARGRAIPSPISGHWGWKSSSTFAGHCWFSCCR